MAKIVSIGKKIIARAKQIRKAHPNKPWLACMKAAGAEYRSGKIGAAPKKKAATKKKALKRWQTGTSNVSRDKMVKAKPPGKRRSASGRTYVERRKNRSDMPGKLASLTPGTPPGSAYREMLIRNLTAENFKLGQAEGTIFRLKKQLATTSDKKMKIAIRKQIKEMQKYRRDCATKIRMTKGLIK